MTEDFAVIKKKKLEELKKRYMDRENQMEDMPDTPVEMTDANINDHINRYGTIVVDCWAPWCAPCLMIHPIIEELAKELQGEVVFGKLNVDNNQSTAAKYGIMSIPSLLVFKEGKLADQIIGAMPKPMLMKKLEPHL